MSGLQRGSFVLVPADRHLSVPWTLAASTCKGLDDFLVRRGGDEPIAETSRHFGRGWPAGGDHHLDRLLRQGVEASVLDRVERAMVALGASLPEEAHDLDGFLQHLLAHVSLWPAITGDVLVQRFAAANAEKESTRHHRGRGGRRLGDDRG